MAARKSPETPKARASKAPARGYGQFCPVAKAAEIVAERWTPLVLRELICGSHRFNEIRRGVPLMSPSLLSRRLKELEDAGVVERRVPEGASARMAEYHLTQAGEELTPVIMGLGEWGHKWARSRLVEEDYDPALLMWDVSRRCHPGNVPGDARTTVQFDFPAQPPKKRRWWLVFEDDDSDLCLKDPGHEVDLYVSTHIRVLTDVWMGEADLAKAIRTDEIDLTGSREHVRAFPRWFGRSVFAGQGS